MLGLVFRSTNFQKLQQTLSLASVWNVVLVVILYASGQFLSSYKWWIIARSGGVTAPYSTALKSYFIGMFVNCFGFGTLGGDLARGVLIAEDKPIKTSAIASVFADRAHGLATLAMIGAISVGLFGRMTLEPFYVLILVLFGTGIFGGWFLAPKLIKTFLPENHKWRKKIDPVLSVFPHQISTVVYITVVSSAFHILQICLHKYMGLSLGVDIPWSYLFVAIPFVNILSTLPISWNGLGVRENAYVFFLSPAVVSKEQALGFGAMWILAVTFCSAVGGIISVVTRDFDKLKKTEAEETAKEEIPSPISPSLES